jgi:hypothetical protein
MPAKNPRLTITLQPSLAAQLRKLSELTGNSQSGLIGELLEGSGPVFDRLIQVLEAAQTAKSSMRGKLADDMERAQTKMEGALGMVLEGFDDITGSLLDEAEAVTRRGRGSASGARSHGPGAAAPTPISNRGVRYDPKATKTIAQSRVSVRPRAKKVGAKNRGGE